MYILTPKTCLRDEPAGRVVAGTRLVLVEQVGNLFDRLVVTGVGACRRFNTSPTQ